MDIKSKIEKEISRMKQLIQDGENIMGQVPKHLRHNQEFVLEIYKKKLAALEQELIRLEDLDSKKIRI